MPLVTGFDVLVYFQGNLVLSAIPIVVFSTSDASHDMEKALNLGALRYIIKPDNLDDYLILVQAIREQIERTPL